VRFLYLKRPFTLYKNKNVVMGFFRLLKDKELPDKALTGFRR